MSGKNKYCPHCLLVVLEGQDTVEEDGEVFHQGCYDDRHGDST